jgi:hypothetical protein
VDSAKPSHADGPSFSENYFCETIYGLNWELVPGAMPVLLMSEAEMVSITEAPSSVKKTVNCPDPLTSGAGEGVMELGSLQVILMVSATVGTGFQLLSTARTVQMT